MERLYRALEIYSQEDYYPFNMPGHKRNPDTVNTDLPFDRDITEIEGFVTPGGRGLKALILHDNTDPDRHRDLYTQLLDKFNVAGKDSACKDMARRNYLSYDPDIWMNPNPVTFHYIPTVRAQGKVIQPHAERKVSDKSIINIINSLWKKNNPEYWKEGNRAESIFKLACLMCKWGVDESLAIGYFTEGWKSPTMSEEEILGHVRNAYRAEKNNFGTLELNVY